MDATIIKKFSQLYVFHLALTEIVLSRNVLIWPTDSSNWLNIKILLEELIQRNHSVTVLAASETLFINSSPHDFMHFEEIPVSYKESNIDEIIKHMIALWLDHRPTPLTM